MSPKTESIGVEIYAHLVKTGGKATDEEDS